MLTTLTDIVTMLPLKLEPPKVLQKPPVVVIQSVTPRPKPRPFLFKFPGSDSMTTTTRTTTTTSKQATPTTVKLALQSVLAMEMSPSSSHNNNNNKSSSNPFLIPSGGGVTKKRHLKPISASSTPTEPYITLEIGLTAARSHSESAFAISGGPNTARMGSASAGLLKRESCSNLPLPMNLISAKNEQKAVVALANTLPIKQQLPMKLAKLGAAMGSSDGHAIGGNSSGGGGNISSHSSPHGYVNASPTGGGLVQQLLPLRLSESLEHKQASPKVPSSTDYLNDFYGSIQIQTQFEQFQSTGQQNCRFWCHNNQTGSSPASIQMLSTRHHHYHTTTTTSFLPVLVACIHLKFSDKPASLLLQQAARGSPQLPPPPAGHHHHHHHQAQPPPKVHDPETNQEIVFL